MSESLRNLIESSALGADHSAFLESLYEQFLADPGSIEPHWREYFSSVNHGATGEQAHGPIREALAQRARNPHPSVATTHNELAEGLVAKQGAVARLVQIICNRGHLMADIDPLGLMKRPEPEVMKLSYFGLSEADLDSEFYMYAPFEPITKATRLKLRDIIARFKQIYCGKIGAEFAHVSDTQERLWLQHRFAENRLHHGFTSEERKTFLWQLTAAEGLERYLATRYPAQKRFSLEGGDSLIPMLDDLIQQGGTQGAKEVVIGMAHRGRLNVLINVLGKSPQDLFSEFEGKYDLNHLKGLGDVKYHKGFSTDIRTPGGNVHVALAFNPSHLEVVNPVVEGSVRARQQRSHDTTGAMVVPILIHGDSAFSGQGVIMETLQMSQVRGYATAGRCTS